MCARGRGQVWWSGWDGSHVGWVGWERMSVKLVGLPAQSHVVPAEPSGPLLYTLYTLLCTGKRTNCPKNAAGGKLERSN